MFRRALIGALPAARGRPSSVYSAAVLSTLGAPLPTSLSTSANRPEPAQALGSATSTEHRRWATTASQKDDNSDKAASDAEPVRADDWFGLNEGIRVSLAEQRLLRPTDVQLASVPEILAGNDILVSSATGTGKTLSYLLPIIHQLKVDELDRGIATRPNKPRALIVVPTRELALQVSAVAKKLSHAAKFTSTVLVGGRKDEWQKDMLERSVDLIVATVGRLQQAMENGWLHLSDVRYLCIDEADTMLSADNGFLEDLQRALGPVLHSMRKREASLQALNDDGATSASAMQLASDSAGIELQKVQVVLVGATMPKDAMRQMAKMFPSVSPVSSLPHSSSALAHRIPATVSQRFVRIGGEPSAKYEALMDVITGFVASSASVSAASDAQPADIKGSDGVSPASKPSKSKPSKRVLVFCNTIDSARATAHFLGEQGYTVASLHGAIPPKLRNQEYLLFSSGTCNVMVCTDAAARGLDFPGLDCAILCDFPLNPVEYIHRAGRVGRAGRHGVVVSLVGKRDSVLAMSIERATQAGDVDVTQLSSDKADYVPRALLGEFKESRNRKAAGAGAGGNGSGASSSPSSPSSMMSRVTYGSGGNRDRRSSDNESDDAIDADSGAGKPTRKERRFNADADGGNNGRRSSRNGDDFSGGRAGDRREPRRESSNRPGRSSSSSSSSFASASQSSSSSRSGLGLGGGRGGDNDARPRFPRGGSSSGNGSRGGFSRDADDRRGNAERVDWKTGRPSRPASASASLSRPGGGRGEFDRGSSRSASSPRYGSASDRFDKDSRSESRGSSRFGSGRGSGSGRPSVRSIGGDSSPFSSSSSFRDRGSSSSRRPSLSEKIAAGNARASFRSGGGGGMRSRSYDSNSSGSVGRSRDGRRSDSFSSRAGGDGSSRDGGERRFGGRGGSAGRDDRPRSSSSSSFTSASTSFSSSSFASPRRAGADEGSSSRRFGGDRNERSSSRFSSDSASRGSFGGFDRSSSSAPSSRPRFSRPASSPGAGRPAGYRPARFARKPMGGPRPKAGAGGGGYRSPSVGARSGDRRRQGGGNRR